MNKIILAQIALKRIWTQWIADSAGVWYVDFNGAYPGIDPLVSASLVTALIENVNSVIVGSDSLTKVTSYTNTVDGRASALSSDASFIWDGAGDILYIRLDEYEPPQVFDVYLGVTLQLSNQAYDDTVNELLYRPDLVGVPDLAEEKDPLFYQRLVFDEWTQNINNAAYQYDDISGSILFGQQVDYYMGLATDPFSEFEKIKTGTIKTYQYSGSQWSLAMIDGRKKLSRKLPVNSLSQTTYTDLRDEYRGKRIPLVYGEVRDHVCIPLDDGAVQTNYTFLIADTEFHDIKSSGYTIKVEGVDKTAQVLNFSDSAGTFQLPAAHYTENEVVTFSGGGYVDDLSVLIVNPLDVVLDLMANYLSIAYTANNFNTTEWDAETLKAADIATAITESRTAIEIISDLATFTGSGFLLERNGLYTWRSFDADSIPVLTIYENQWKAFPAIVGREEEILTSATVKYDRALSSGRWSRVTDESQEEELKELLGGSYRDKEFDSLYVNESDALDYAQGIMARSDEEGIIITGIIDDKYINYSIAKIGKIAQIEVNRILDAQTGTYTEWFGKMNCEILAVIPNIESRDAELILRKIEDLDNFVFLYDGNGEATDNIYDGNGDSNSTILDANGE